MAKTDLTLTLLLLEAFSKPWESATPTSHPGPLPNDKSCGGLVEIYHAAKEWRENALQWAGKMPPLSVCPSSPLLCAEKWKVQGYRQAQFEIQKEHVKVKRGTRTSLRRTKEKETLKENSETWFARLQKWHTRRRKEHEIPRVPFILWGKKKFALFVILNLWITAGLTISRQEPETSQGSASQLSPDNIPPCKAAQLWWTMPQPHRPSSSFLASHQCLHSLRVNPEHGHHSCFTSLPLQQGGEKPPHGLLRDWKTGELQTVGNMGFSVSQAKFKAWSFQSIVKNYSIYPFHNVWSVHTLSIHNINWKGKGGEESITNWFISEK